MSAKDGRQFRCTAQWHFGDLPGEFELHEPLARTVINNLHTS
jgi:hypothetical protein